MPWGVLFLAASALAGPPELEELEERVTGAVFAELGGPGLIYSLNGQVLLPTSFGGIGLRAGGSYVYVPPNPGVWDALHYAAFPTALTLRIGHRTWAFEGGVAANPMLWFGDGVFLLAPIVGVDHRAPSGLLFGAHAQVNVSVSGEGLWPSRSPVWPWAGIRVGYWFPRS